MSNPKYNPGATVTWTSQAAGGHKTKTGKVIAFIPAGTRVDAVAPFLKDEAPARRAALGNGLSASTNDRYLIAVPRKRARLTGGGRVEDLTDYYAPLASVVDRGAPQPSAKGDS